MTDLTLTTAAVNQQKWLLMAARVMLEVASFYGRLRPLLAYCSPSRGKTSFEKLAHSIQLLAQNLLQ